MATFTLPYQNTLPDPNNTFAEAGGGLSSINGPGYASVKLSSDQKIMNTRTNSGRLISRSSSGHKWGIDISYNPMTREEFEPVYSFISQQKSSLKPFYVSLPQYRVPRDPLFATYVASNTFTSASLYYNGFAGTTALVIQHAGYNWATHGSAKPGDLFTVEDSGNSSHTKVYQITRVETENIQLAVVTNALVVTQQRIHFTPPMQRTLTGAANVNFHNPKFRVILTSDMIEYSLNTNNLYSFSLKLEEAQN